MNRHQATAAAAAIGDHYRQHRRDLPWRRTADPYGIWISEIMLQQTRVATAIPYWERWMQRFPTVEALAAAPIDDVLAAWAGLGYYGRARNLHRGAAEVVARWRGQLPNTAHQLLAVPGIGRYTAGAVASIAFGEAAPLVDGNVARVLARYVGLDADVRSSGGQAELWRIAGELMAARPTDLAPGELNQGLMELGATVCTPQRPSCATCPLTRGCVARKEDRVAELPVLAKRKGVAELPLLEVTALWILDHDRLLLARRRPGGLFGGLWELPQASSAGAAAALVGIRIGDGPMVARHRQVLSHRRLCLDVVAPSRWSPLGSAADSGYDAVTWHPLAEVASLAVSKATTTIVRRFRDTPWNPTKKPSPASSKASRRSSKASAPSATTSPTTTSRRRRRGRRAASTSSSSTPAR